MKTTKTEIVICPKCLGAGKNYERVSAYDSEYVFCQTCDGSGLVRKTITELIEPR